MRDFDEMFLQVAESYGGPQEIPHDILYMLLLRVKASLETLAQEKKINERGEEEYTGCKEIEESHLGREVRHRCLTDLFWLTRYFLWETNVEGAGKPMVCHKCKDRERPYRECTHINKVTERTHGPICNLFVKKNPDLHFADQDEVCKQRMLLYPRGSFKSTVDVADVVQWILNKPEVRVLFLTAGQNLAVGFVDETKGHFVEKLYDKSLMNVFFHDFCLPEKEIAKMSMYEFDCPVWTKKGIMRREHTVMALSIESKMSGFHFEVIKADDTVETKNSENEELCAKVIKNFYVNIKMLMPYGYLDIIGTRYHDLDLYGEYLEKNAPLGNDAVKRDEQKSKCWMFIENTDTGFKALIGTGWQIKPEWEEKVEKALIKEADVPEEGYWVMFPENLPFKKLYNEKFKKDEVSFESQIQQNPRSKTIAVFTRSMLVANTLSPQELPINGPKVITWDFAFSKEKKRDYSTAVVGQYDSQGRLYIINIVRQRFKPIELAQAFVALAKAYKPIIIGVENAAGSRLIEPSLLIEAQKTGDPAVVALMGRIDWFKPDNNKGAKTTRMAALAPMLTYKQLFFSRNLPMLELLYEEFERCLTSARHDDIPDVISFQMKYVPRMNLLIEKKDIQTYSKMDISWNLLYEEGYRPPGRGFVFDPETNTWIDTAAPVNPIAPQIDRGLPAETPSSDLDPILGSGIIG